jgi:putative peptide zinc metalloprotease protein
MPSPTPDVPRLRFRDDLIVLPGTIRGERVYTLEDPLSGQFFQLGASEYNLLKQLDGRTTFDEARRRTEHASDRPRLSETKAAEIARHAVAAGLCTAAGAAPSPKRPASKVRLSSPIFFRIPLLQPDAWVTRITPWLAWLYSPAAMVGAALLAIAATCVLTIRGEAFVASATAIFTPDQRLWTVAAWLVLKVLHEISHAVVCKKYGGQVKEAGVALLLFAPLPYVDVTSSWRFRSKWERIFTAAAGVYVECLAAAAAVVAWQFLPPGAGQQACVQIAAMAALGTLAFNLNPLMRFDGYYILTDLIESPNLYTDSLRYLRSLAKRHFLGVASPRSAGDPRRRRLLLTYGLAAMIWRMLACVSLVIAAAYLFHGAGLAIAVAAAAAWWGAPLAKLALYLLRPPPGEHPRRLRFAALVVGTLGGAAALAFWTPWPGAANVPAIIDFDPLLDVRAVQPGFVREVRVRDGQHVQAGEVIARLENEELALEIAQLKLALQQSESRGRTLQHRRDLAALQAEEAERQSLVTKLAELRTRAESLTIRAPTDGVIVARGIKMLLGRYLKTGDEVCIVAGDDRVARALVSQDEIEAFRARVGEAVTVRLPGSRPLPGTLATVVPSASRTPPHPAFCAVYGGPLAVETKAGSGKEELLELVEPQFAARIRLPAGALNHPYAGQRAEVRLTASHETIAAHLRRILRAWLESKAAK